jgi:hypothetical protein
MLILFGYQYFFPTRGEVCNIDQDRDLKEIMSQRPDGARQVPSGLDVQQGVIRWRPLPISYTFRYPSKTAKAERIGIFHSFYAICRVRGNDGKWWLVNGAFRGSHGLGYVPEEMVVIE